MGEEGCEVLRGGREESTMGCPGWDCSGFAVGISDQISWGPNLKVAWKEIRECIGDA